MSAGADGALWTAAPWVAVDLEMTGLDPAADAICEVGLIRWEGEQEACRSWLVRPPVPMTPDAIRVTGLTDSALSGAPRLGEVLPEVLEALSGATWVGHRAGHDLSFFNQALREAGLPEMAAARFDTLQIARDMLALPSHRLGDLGAALGVPVPGAHRALADAAVTKGVFQTFARWVDPAGRLTVDGLGEAFASRRAGSAARIAQLIALQHALKDKRRVEIDYFSRSEHGTFERVRRWISVLELSGPRVRAFCHLREAERVFRIDRVWLVGAGW